MTSLDSSGSRWGGRRARELLEGLSGRLPKYSADVQTRVGYVWQTRGKRCRRQRTGGLTVTKLPHSPITSSEIQPPPRITQCRGLAQRTVS